MVTYEEKRSGDERVQPLHYSLRVGHVQKRWPLFPRETATKHSPYFGLPHGTFRFFMWESYSEEKPNFCTRSLNMAKCENAGRSGGGHKVSEPARRDQLTSLLLPTSPLREKSLDLITTG